MTQNLPLSPQNKFPLLSFPTGKENQSITKQEHKWLLFKGAETVESTAGAWISPHVFTLNRSQNI